MIIEACHIAQFGKWKDADFSFSPGKNSFLWDNGYGKTSFIYFFKLMFYGVSGDRKQDLEENERKHYMPFQGASFGGRIIFRIGEKRYRLERSFGLKKSEDSFRLFDEDSGKESKDYSENIGEELFSLDAESFQRVCMISHEDLHFSMNSRMHAKLGNVAEDQEDMKKFQQVQTILKDGINALSPNRRTGNIFKLKMQEEELSSGLYGKEALENAVLSIEKEVLSLTEKEAQRKEEGKALEEELSQRISEKDSLGKWMSYAQKKEEWEKAEYRYENALKWYYQDRFSEIPEEKKTLLWKEEMQSLQEQIHSIKKEIEKVSEVGVENIGGKNTGAEAGIERELSGTSPAVLFALAGLGLLFVLLFFGKLFGMPWDFHQPYSYCWGFFPLVFASSFGGAENRKSGHGKKSRKRKRPDKESNRQYALLPWKSFFPVFISWKICRI